AGGVRGWRRGRVAQTGWSVSSRPALERGAAAASAPASASATAMARPSPRLAPVTMATRPSRRKAAGARSAVEGIEELPVLLGDDLALDLEGRGQQAVLYREITRQDRELLHLRVGLQLAVALLHDARHALDHLRVLHDGGW